MSSKKNKTLLLDQDSIKKILTMKEAIKAVEQAFVALGQGQTQMPAKLYLQLDQFNGDFRAMPASIANLKSCSLKWVNVHPNNTSKGLASVMALLILSDPRNGLPLCVMDATYITALRTAAAGAVAAKYLAIKNVKRVALIGCGVQAYYQLMALLEIYKLEQVSVWGPNQQEGKQFVSKIRKSLSAKVELVTSPQSCVQDADLVVTTTPSKKPLIKFAWIKAGAHINAIGADAKGKQELDITLLKKSKIIVDAWEQASHSGEINVPLSKSQMTKKDIVGDIGQIVTAKKKGRMNSSEITVFDSTGLAIQDTAVANVVYQKAKRLKDGHYFNFL